MKPHRFGLHHMERPFMCQSGHGHISADAARGCDAAREARLKREHPELDVPLKPFPAGPTGEQQGLFEDLA